MCLTRRSRSRSDTSTPSATRLMRPSTFRRSQKPLPQDIWSSITRRRPANIYLLRSLPRPICASPGFQRTHRPPAPGITMNTTHGPTSSSGWDRWTGETAPTARSTRTSGRCVGSASSGGCCLSEGAVLRPVDRSRDSGLRRGCSRGRSLLAFLIGASCAQPPIPALTLPAEAGAKGARALRTPVECWPSGGASRA
jgi:hypothetical protein